MFGGMARIGRRRAEMNISDAQVQQCQQDNNRLLLISGDIERDRQLVDIA